MGRIYMFNTLISDVYGPSITITVNGASPAYKISNTSKAIDYVPNSTSGAHVPGNQPNGNQFKDINQLLVQSDAPRLFQFDLLTYGGDLIAYFFRETIILFGENGLYLQTYQHSGSTPTGEASADPAVIVAEAGSVHIFNLFSELVTISANGGTIGEIPAWSNGGDSQPPIYTPTYTIAQRVLNPSDGKRKIVNGNNTITVRGESVGSFRVPIDGTRYPLNQNLLLYVMRDYWFLGDQFSNIIVSGPITFAQANDVDLCQNH